MQPCFEWPGLERLPARIGVEIHRQHRLAVERRGSAGTDIRTDRNAVQRPRIVFGKAGAAERMNQSAGVDIEQRGHHVRCDLLDAPAQLVGYLANRDFVGQRAHDELLQRPQLLAFGDVGQQAEHVFDLPALVAKRLDGGRDPDLVAIFVVDEDFLFAAGFDIDPAPQLCQRPAVGMPAHDEFAGPPSLGLLDRVSEHRGKRRVGIDDLEIAIGDDDGAVGLVGDQFEHGHPFAAYDLPGDISDVSDGAALTVGRDARQRQRDTQPAAVLALNLDFGCANLIGVVVAGSRQVAQSEAARVAIEHFRAIQPPDDFSRGVEMADALIAIDDHNGVVRPLECCEQDVRRFDREMFVFAHRRTLLTAWNPSGPWPDGEAW